MVLKGKTIQTVSDTSYSSNSLKPSKSITPVTEVTENCTKETSMLKKAKTITQVTELEFNKTVIQNQTTPNDVIKIIQNIRYPLNYLKIKFPGFNSLYYSEIFDLLETTDFNLNEHNLNTNIQKFINLGNNIQSQISRLHTNLEILGKTSFNKIKEKYSSEIGFFTSDNNFKTIFIEFNAELSDYYGTLYKELNNLKLLDFNKLNLINLYFDFFLFISDELQNKKLIDTSGIIQSRVLSLNNSKTVLEQFKNLIQIEIQGKEIEYNNIKNYFDVLNPSLHLLRTQNFKEFKEQFKKFIKI
jgi:hypothetical protein